MSETETETSTLKDIFEKSRRWDQDAVLDARKSARIAWIVASCATLVAITACIAVAGLTPLKEKEPFLIRVDNSTGIIDTVDSLKIAPETYDEAIRRYFVGNYIRFRANYSASELQYNFDAVVSMSTPPVAEDYAREMSGNNPQSPQLVYGTTSTVTTSIKAVQLINDNVATVRFVKSVALVNTQSKQQTHWVATVNFTILPETELSITQRFVNPIGFVVTGYRIDPEVAP